MVRAGAVRDAAGSVGVIARGSSAAEAGFGRVALDRAGGLDLARPEEAGTAAGRWWRAPGPGAVRCRSLLNVGLLLWSATAAISLVLRRARGRKRGREGGERAEGEERGGGASRRRAVKSSRRPARDADSPRPRTGRTSPCSGCRAGPSSASAWVTSPARASSRRRVARAPQPRDAPIPLRSRAHAGGSSRASSLREVAANLRRRSARDFTRALVVRRRFARPLRVAADRWGPPTPPRRGTPPLRPPRPSPLRRRRTTARRSRSASPR